MKQKLFRRDFTLVAIGQIISLFGNAALRFALPLYLLNQTGSSRLYGLVTACAFIPAILLSPVGGIAADRFNKRNIMVLLDFFTAALIIAVSLLLESVNLVALLAAALILFYGIAGAYQPAVQASVPALVEPEQLMQANSVINMIASLAALAGPALGGILYSVYGLKTVLAMCAACFTTSAIMELFIRIPFVKQPADGSMWQTVKTDIADSVRFIAREKPAIGRVMLVVCGVNLTLSSMIVVGIPYLVTEVLPLESSLANTLCGFAQGALAAGSLTRGRVRGTAFPEKRRRSDCGLCRSHVPDWDWAGGMLLRNGELRYFNRMLLWSHGCLHAVYRTDNVVHSGGDAPASDRESRRRHPCHRQLRPAPGQCPLWRAVRGVQRV